VPPGGCDDYVELVCGPMLDAVAPHVRWADVFCEPARSTPTSPARCSPPREAGLGLRVHGTNSPWPGCALAVELGAAAWITAPT